MKLGHFLPLTLLATILLGVSCARGENNNKVPVTSQPGRLQVAKESIEGHFDTSVYRNICHEHFSISEYSATQYTIDGVDATSHTLFKSDFDKFKDQNKHSIVLASGGWLLEFQLVGVHKLEQGSHKKVCAKGELDGCEKIGQWFDVILNWHKTELTLEEVKRFTLSNTTDTVILDMVVSDDDLDVCYQIVESQVKIQNPS